MIDNKFTVVIIDDESICIENIEKSLTDYPEFTISAIAQNPTDGKVAIVQHRPDLLFLDVEMPGQSGLDLLTEVRDRISWPMQVIFYTAYEKYLLQALRNSAFDFLLKPYQQGEFKLVLDRFFSYSAKTHNQNTFRDSLMHLIPCSKTFLIATITGYQMLRPEQIGFFEYDKAKKLWVVALSDQKKLQLKRNTTAEDILNYAQSFIQISQYQIINFDYLSSIEGKNCQLLPPFHNENQLNISRIFLKAMQERFDVI